MLIEYQNNNNKASKSLVQQKINYPENYTVKIYPNPFSEILNIDLNNNEGRFHSHIYDFFGRKVTDQFFEESILTINTESLTTGSYFIKILDDEKNLIYLNKIIKK